MMMQSILLNTPLPPGELKPDDQSALSEDETLMGEGAEQFLDLLGSVIGLTGATGEEAGEITTEEVSVDFLTDGLADDIEDNISTDELALLSTELVEGQLPMESGEHESIEQSPAILAQIEEAQKIDTQVSEQSEVLPGNTNSQVFFEQSNVDSEALATEGQNKSLQPGNVESLTSVNAEQAKIQSSEPSNAWSGEQGQATPITAEQGNVSVQATPITTDQGKVAQSISTDSIGAGLSDQSKVTGPTKVGAVEIGSTVTKENNVPAALNVEPNVAREGKLSTAVKTDSLIAKKSKIGDLKSSGSKSVQVDSMSGEKSTLLSSVKDEPLKIEMPFQLADKHGEVEKNALTHHGLDNNSLRSTDVNSSTLNKLVNHNMQAATTTSTLQQSLDLHSKHASALLGERVLMMMKEGKQEVQIRLDPAELGSMNIKLQMHQNQLHLSIQTDVNQSKDIIEQNLPKLREQLAQQGVNLGEASVEQHARGQQQNSNQEGENAMQNNVASSNESILQVQDEEIGMMGLKIPLSPQGIDYYA